MPRRLWLQTEASPSSTESSMTTAFRLTSDLRERVGGLGSYSNGRTRRVRRRFPRAVFSVVTSPQASLLFRSHPDQSDPLTLPADERGEAPKALS